MRKILIFLALLLAPVAVWSTTPTGTTRTYIYQIAGSTNQVVINRAGGVVTITLPQDIGTGSSPTFFTVTASSQVKSPQFVGTGGAAPVFASTQACLTFDLGLSPPAGHSLVICSTYTAVLYASGTVVTYADPFNTANNLVKTDSSNRLPALDGSLLTSLPSAPGDAWSLDGNTWTALGPSSIAVNADMTTKAALGDKLKLLQGGATQYFYILSDNFTSAVSTITVALTTTSTLSAGAITTAYFSHQQTPTGFPKKMAFTTTYGGFSSNPTPSTLDYWMDGPRMHLQNYMIAVGTSSANSLTMTGPCTSTNKTAGQNNVGPWVGDVGGCVDNGSLQTVSCQWNVGPNTPTITFFKTKAQTTWTTSGLKGVAFSDIVYECQ